jgi:transcriptional regulator with XRE-family HTH domain
MPTPFSSFLRSRRQQLGATHRDIARGIGIHSPDFIGLVERGRRRFDLSRIPAVATVLDVEVPMLCRLALEQWHPLFYAGLTEKATQ